MVVRQATERASFSLLTLVRLAEGTGGDTGVAGEELAEVGGFGETQAAGEGRHRFVGVGEQAPGLQATRPSMTCLTGWPVAAVQARVSVLTV